MQEPAYAGAIAPERSRRVASRGLTLHVVEWGDPQATPVLLCHGMFDLSRGFDLLAPLLAERFRVVALDACGHGDSDWADAYTWETDVEDVVAVLASLEAPAHLVGHSRGGGLASDAALRAPERVRGLVNIDGFGPPAEGFVWPGRDLPSPSVAERLAAHLDWRRTTSRRDGWRPYARFEDLVERRRAQNPRLSREWLAYFLFHASRRVEGGFVWKADPHAGRGFGPFRPEWIGPSWARLRAPMLAIIGSEPDTWGPLPEALLRERLAHVPKLERGVVPGAGHFVHMEQPAETARLVTAFLERL
jgi:pimeloyl-ACP methyl ester carboxylesterase